MYPNMWFLQFSCFYNLPVIAETFFPTWTFANSLHFKHVFSLKWTSILKFFFKFFFFFLNPNISFHFQQGEALLGTQFENIFTRTNKGESLMKTHEKNNAIFNHVCRWTKARNTVATVNRCHLLNTCSNIIKNVL